MVILTSILVDLLFWNITSRKVLYLYLEIYITTHIDPQKRSLLVNYSLLGANLYDLCSNLNLDWFSCVK